MNNEAEPGMVVERDLIVPARDGVGLATDVFRPASGGPFPVLLERTPYNKSAPSRSERTAAALARRDRRLLRAARLRRCLSGLPWALQVGRTLYKVSERGRGRLRHARLDHASALVQRPHRHFRPVLRGAHP